MNQKHQYTVVVAGMGKRGTHHPSAFQKNSRFKLTIATTIGFMHSNSPSTQVCRWMLDSFQNPHQRGGRKWLVI
jgi:hypothetical protein